jgi:hypothetical protein
MAAAFAFAPAPKVLIERSRLPSTVVDTSTPQAPRQYRTVAEALTIHYARQS